MPRTGGHYISMPSRLCATDAPARPTGRSRDETLAQRWSDVDLTNSILRVRGTLSRADGHLVISEPRTERSPRNVPLSPATVAPLRSVKASQAVERLKAASILVETGLVFTTGAGQQSTLGGTAGDQRQPRLWE
jgi:integrase